MLRTATFRNDVFSALSEPTRREIVEMLARGGRLQATDIYKKFDVSAPAISQHLRVLRESKLVQVEKQAQRRLYTINPEKISELESWAKKLNQVWNERLDRLDALLKEE